MLQLTMKGLVVRGQFDALRDNFAMYHCVVLERLLEPALLEKVQRQMEQASWRSAAFDDFGTEFTLDHAVTTQLLIFLLNIPDFLSAIRVITACPQVSEFTGRVYRMTAGPQHQLSWHDDTKERTRQVGLSMNLSADVFCGGTFELRDRRTRTQLAQVNNTGFGDALLFRISQDLEHRVTEVMGKANKTACAGWFLATGTTLPKRVARSASATRSTLSL